MPLMFEAAEFFSDATVQAVLFGLAVLVASFVVLTVGSFLICVKE